ncbi:MAG TPA: glutaredoxin family protein [Candidatus Limnocylindrales bacterium]|nr:glutaredoxin family protein [Candidatus Limnocylindrales bacterium]
MLEIVLYARPGCHLCVEARTTVDAILAERRQAGLAAPPIVERDISTDPGLERAFFAEIPVVEVGDRRLTLAVSPRGLRRFLDDVLGPVLAG